jgi:type III restriction enzyme
MQLVPTISARLSLRKPQRESLEILHHVISLINQQPNDDLASILKAIQAHYPQVTDFERDFPSLCFALATGVGKTRLMGAFISYLFLSGVSRHFFVLAPNLTIYEKLITDFSRESPKYVFRGISEFVNHPPVVITGDNYQDGKSIRQEFMGFSILSQFVHVNIFNISKINTEVRSGAAPRIKRLQEYVGQSYFDYLAGLDDLVLIMDEAHRYRATAGSKAINELKPILGLELTATPQVEQGTSMPVPFKNVIYQYSLAKALDDGFIKDPAVATRQNFNSDQYTKDEGGQQKLEKIKLEDAIHNHETIKVQLEVYANNTGKPLVKPFILVIAQDTAHAAEIRKIIESDSFFEGRYKGKVLEIHSNQRGEEKDENVQRLLQIEKSEEDAEIVVHVNQLKEGWDVTNLYTIVPLRKANSKTLVEQAIGRGLRLPYGERVGVTAVDRLTIIAHDRFKEIIDAANDPNSIIRSSVIIGQDVPLERPIPIVVPSIFESRVAESTLEYSTAAPLFSTPQEQQLANLTRTIIQKYEHLPSSAMLTTPEIREKICKELKEIVTPTQLAIEGITKEPDYPDVVEKVTDLFIETTIDIPKVSLTPTNEISSGFKDFDLDTSSIHLQPVSQEILIHYLKSNETETITPGAVAVLEPRPENYIVRQLMNKEQVSYDEQSDLLYKLVGQIVMRLKSYLSNEDDIVNVLQYYQQHLSDLVFSQMMQHYWETEPKYHASISQGFSVLKPNMFQSIAGSTAQNFRVEPQNKSQIKSMYFSGFKRCCYPVQKFDSDTERLFAVVLENFQRVLKWMKPAPGQFRIEYKGGHSYNPDFVVETDTCKYICESKAANEIDTDEVLAKSAAAIQWCSYANEHAKQNKGKEWSYLLIPHTAIKINTSFETLVATCTKPK